MCIRDRTKNFQRISIPKLPVFTTEDGIRTIKQFLGKLSDWKNIEDLIPLDFKNSKSKSRTGNAGILSAAIGLLALNMFGVGGIISGASFVMKGMMATAGLLKTAFIFIGGKLMLIGSTLMASIIPMAAAALPFIAIGAAVLLAFGAVITAIQNIRARFTEGQTILERIKIIAQEIFLAPVRLFQNIFGFWNRQLHGSHIRSRSAMVSTYPSFLWSPH